jgi:peroxiredoxin
VPPLRLERFDGEPFTEADLAGKTTVLVFYPFAFSSVCTDQLSLYDQLRGEFEDLGATLYGVSCDSVWSQAAFKERLGIEIEQLSDFEPKGAACKALGVYHPGGFPQRAIIIVGPDGRVKWSYQADSPGELPGANLIFDGLQAG